jgi:hypothetical protein
MGRLAVDECLVRRRRPARSLRQLVTRQPLGARAHGRSKTRFESWVRGRGPFRARCSRQLAPCARCGSKTSRQAPWVKDLQAGAPPRRWRCRVVRGQTGVVRGICGSEGAARKGSDRLLWKQEGSSRSAGEARPLACSEAARRRQRDGGQSDRYARPLEGLSETYRIAGWWSRRKARRPAGLPLYRVLLLLLLRGGGPAARLLVTGQAPVSSRTDPPSAKPPLVQPSALPQMPLWPTFRTCSPRDATASSCSAL